MRPSSRLQSHLTLGATLSGIAAAMPSAYLAGLSLAALGFQRDSSVLDSQVPRVAVLVPAHDEEILIGRVLGSLKEQDYPKDRIEIVVVADNCSDATAQIASELGVRVLERHDKLLPGKGRALRWAMESLLADDSPPDAFVVVDADSVAEPGMVTGLARAMQSGAEVVQGDYTALIDSRDPKDQLRNAAFVLYNRVRPMGKAVLGRPTGLLGNGMLFSSRVAREHPWSAFSEVEDLEYGIHLRLAGIGPVYAADARLSAPVATTGASADVQRTRWEGGRLRSARIYLPQVLRSMLSRRQFGLWDAAADLSVPPIGVLATASIAGSSSTFVLWRLGAVRGQAVLPWALAGALLPVHVLVGLRAGQAPPGMLAALKSAPRLVLGDTAIRLKLVRRGKATSWERTPRST